MGAIRNLHDALTSHGIGLFIHTLDIPERLLLVLVIGTHDDRNDIKLQPKTGAECWAHVLERRWETGTNEFGKVLVLVLLHLGDDMVSDQIGAHSHGIVEHNVLDREIN